jgi:ABC-type antimicrobial peptide transport system permease subunit
LSAADAANAETTPQVLLVRTRGPASAHVAAISAALQGAMPGLPFVNVRTLLDLADLQARSWLLGATLFGLFGSLALALAGIGIYGALAFAVRRRMVEIGLRIAVGASRGDIARMVFRLGARVVVVGVVLGLAGALVGSRYLERVLFNVLALDPWTFAVATLVVIGAALLGCVLPVVHATRVDPVVALRAE